MTAPTGRREAHKQATRAALRAAAKRLFAEQGYEATTVGDIARAANVTQRTFYRYYEGKEDLMAGEFRSWLGIIAGAIAARPADEPPLAAVHQAMISMVRQAATDDAPAAVWLTTGRPLEGVRRSGARPILRLEGSIADAVAGRLSAGRAVSPAPALRARLHSDGDDADPGEDFAAEVIARTAVAALRSALARHRELLAAGGDSPGVEHLLDQAFALIGGQGRTA